jgi:molecular chaperone DnaK
MGALIGIDLGTTFSAVATLDDTGRPTIIHNQEGQNITPSCVTLDGPNSVLVGEVARRSWATSPKSAAARFKRDMGTSAVHSIGDRTFTPTELSALVLKKLAKDAAASVGPIDEAVVTIPANFANEAREATMAAAKAAGLNIRYIINEPTAAALYYAFKNGQELNGYYAVYDLGGGTFDVSVIKVAGQQIDVVATGGVSKLGGDDFDAALHELVCQKFKQATGKEIAPRDYTRGDAEEDKKSLSNRKQVVIDAGGQTITVTRDEFEQTISGRISQAELLCEATLDEAKLRPSDIQAVLLAGGSTRIPAVRESVKRVFRQEPNVTANVDEVVALGAALYVAYRSDRSKLSEVQRQAIQKIQVSEVTAMCFGTLSLTQSEATGVPRIENTVLIKRLEKIPCNVTQTFYTVSDGQIAVSCELTESLNPETDQQFVKIIWKGNLELPPNRPQGQPIDITYSYDANQMMRCSFVDRTSGRRTDVEIKLASVESSGVGSVEQFMVE